MLPTSIVDALSSEARPLKLEAFRCVENQARAATMALTDSLEEQATLELLLEEFKPQVQADCGDLHYLYFTPFRYAPYPSASRFRPEAPSEGVLYAALSPSVAVLEVLTYRWRFFQESPGLDFPSRADELSVIDVGLDAQLAVDLSQAPFSDLSEAWQSTDYSACHDLALKARTCGVQALVYPSTQDLPPELDQEPTDNLAVLDCRAIERRQPSYKNWRFFLSKAGIRAEEVFGNRAFHRAAKNL